MGLAYAYMYVILYIFQYFIIVCTLWYEYPEFQMD